MASVRAVVFGTTTMYPVPGSIKWAYENVDAGGNGKPNVRNANPVKLECEVVLGSAGYGAAENPDLADLEALRTKTNALPDTSAKTASATTDWGATVSLTQATIKIDSADGDGAMVAKITIKGNKAVA
jgi:hypothetical protein